MFNMMLGIAEAIGNIFTGLFKWLVDLINTYVVVPALEIVFTLIKWISATFFYTISNFLLGIIDFLESLFRAFIGLSPTGNAMWNISFGGKSGDLLIQMITSKEVMMAFQSTAIVGIFLLIIMTIFQMIKVEYTTEGAENSKTKILGKSLKSLTNLLLIPALCVFGIFIGNQILDLIDTATKSSSGAKISGTLFVTAASEAMYQGGTGDGYIRENATTIATGVATGQVIPMAVLLIVDLVFDGGYNKDYTVDFDRTTVENNFISYSEGYRYDDINNVCKYYNLFEINYLILILGACIVLKSLFFVCFGLVDRLYRCIALFIIVPFVIGMTPIKEGNLATWRGAFIGKALAAYGTVISINLFFIIVSLLLNIDISVTANYGLATGSQGALGLDTFYAGLIKTIFVIVGCLMIEKLSAEMGNYFGASDGMAAGKGLSKEVGSSAMKAGVAAAGVAMGGIGLAAKGSVGLVKGGIGIAKKIGKGTYGTFGGYNNKKQLDFKNKIGHTENNLEGLYNMKQTTSDLKEWKSLSDRDESSLTKVEREKKSSLEKKLEIKNKDDGMSKYESYIKGDKSRDEAIKENEKDLKKYTKKLAANEDWNENNHNITKKAGWAHIGRDIVKSARKTSTGIGLGMAGLKHFGQEGVKSVLPKQLTGLGDSWEKHMEKGSANNEHLKAAYEEHKKARDQREKDRFNGPIITLFGKAKEKTMTGMMVEGIVKSNKSNMTEMKNTVKQLEKALVDAIDKKAKANGDPDAVKYYNDIILNKREELSNYLKADIDITKPIDSQVDNSLANRQKETQLKVDQLAAIIKANQGKTQKELNDAIDNFMKTLNKDPEMLAHIKKLLEEMKDSINK